VVVSKQIELPSDGRFNVINITDQVRAFVQDCGLVHGQVLVFFQHTTGAVIIGEHEAGIIADLNDLMERIIPTDYPYIHHIRAVDFNGHAHIRAAIMPTSVTVPVVDGKLALGTYQEVLVIDDQVDFEPRFILLQAIGELQ
jgi:secondary thiamine-phosphate synthase enzyme